MPQGAAAAVGDLRYGARAAHASLQEVGRRRGAGLPSTAGCVASGGPAGRAHAPPAHARVMDANRTAVAQACLCIELLVAMVGHKLLQNDAGAYPRVGGSAGRRRKAY